MLKRFLPRQDNFFIYFKQSVDLALNASQQFFNLLNNLKNLTQYVTLIAEQENEGDKIAHHTYQLLHKNFITPFDRHDIHYLVAGLDDILDLINRCAQRFPIYQLTTVPEPIIKLAKESVDMLDQLKIAIYHLDNLANGDLIFDCCDKIDALESEAHATVLIGENDLFQQVSDFKLFYKLKQIYSQTKATINRIQDVSNIIKGIVLEYS